MLAEIRKRPFPWSDATNIHTGVLQQTPSCKHVLTPYTREKHIRNTFSRMFRFITDMPTPYYKEDHRLTVLRILPS